MLLLGKMTVEAFDGRDPAPIIARDENDTIVFPEAA